MKPTKKALESLEELDKFILELFHKHKDELQGILEELKDFFRELDFENKVKVISYISNTLADLFLNEISKDFIIFNIEEALEEEKEIKTH